MKIKGTELTLDDYKKVVEENKILRVRMERIKLHFEALCKTMNNEQI